MDGSSMDGWVTRVNFFQFNVNFFSSLTRLLITYAWFAMAERKRKRETERWNYLIEENVVREKLKFIFFWFVVFFVCLFEISPLFPCEVFFDQNYLSPNKKSPCRNVFAPKMFSEDTLIYVKKPFRMTFH